jgi:hypothetical protein
VGRRPRYDRKPTASVACSNEAVQSSAKAGANRMELLELENVIGDHPRAGLVRGSRSRASSPQSHGSKEKGSPRVGEVRAACRRAGKSVVTLSRSSLLTLSRLRAHVRPVSPPPRAHRTAAARYRVRMLGKRQQKAAAKSVTPSKRSGINSLGGRPPSHDFLL